MKILLRSVVPVLKGIVLDEGDGIDVIFIDEIGNRVSKRENGFIVILEEVTWAVREEGFDWRSISERSSFHV